MYIDDHNNLVESSDISLNGTNLATNVLTGINEVLWMEVSSVGSNETSVGNIRLRINGGTVEVEQISASSNRSMSARFMVPAGYTGYLHSWSAQSANNDQDVRLRASVYNFDRSISTVFHFQDIKLVATNSNTGIMDLPFVKLPELSKIHIATISAGTGSNVKCEASFQIVLIAN